MWMIIYRNDLSNMTSQWEKKCQLLVLNKINLNGTKWLNI